MYITCVYITLLRCTVDRLYTCIHVHMYIWLIRRTYDTYRYICIHLCCSVLQCVGVCCSVVQSNMYSKIRLLRFCSRMHRDFSSGEQHITHCNTLQHTATHCNTLSMVLNELQCVAVCCTTHCNALQHTATHCNTLQHTATHCITLHYTALNCNTLQHPATPCSTHRALLSWGQHIEYCNTLQNTATHCNTLQRT